VDEPAYRLTAAATAEALDSPGDGLDPVEAARRLAEHGPNELVDRGSASALQIFLGQFKEVLIWVLLAAAGISVALGDWIEAVAILAIVVLSAVMGFVQEYRAEEAMAALQAMAVPLVRVRRGGEAVDVPAKELVPGDRLLLETGNVVPADARLVSAVNLRVEEAALTGESEAVQKEADAAFTDEQALGDRVNVVYMGTTVAIGRGEAIVTGTGMDTELGRIAELLQEVTDDQTPLQRRLDQLGKVLAVAAGAIVLLLAGLGLARGEDWETILLTSVSLAVAAIPEAMPAVVTIALSLGAQRMLARNALIRRLPAVETLGSVNVICSDKTGTLTENRMTMVVLDVAEHRLTFTDAGIEDSGPAPRATLDLALLTGLMCNDASPKVDADVLTADGEPTEAALVVAATRAGLAKAALEAVMPRIGEVPFDSTRKRMTTLHRLPDRSEVPGPLVDLFDLAAGSTPAEAAVVGFSKGAVSSLLETTGHVWHHGAIVPLDDGWRARIEGAEESLAAEGKRVLGLAVRAHAEVPEQAAAEDDLVFVGMVGLIDPARGEVPAAVARCRSAGIRPVMITGDHPLTAAAIARDVGIAEAGTVAVTGLELDRFTEAEFASTAETASVFARVSPEHKLRLVDALQEAGHLVAMTGDGVNDAPALKSADIGVAMGITGTDVTKQAADMVLLDDNFATIVAAVEEGRVIYDNIRKFIRYLLTCNASELVVMLLGPLFGMPLPLLPLQILWMNLVTDGLPALALGVEPAEDDVMDREPRSADESVFGGGTATFIGVFGTLMSVVTLGLGWWAWRVGLDHWQSVLFTVLVFAQLGLALEIRSDHHPIWRGFWSNRAMLGAVALGIVLHLGIIYLPFAQTVFETQPLTVAELGWSVAGAAAVMAGVEAWKWRSRRQARVR
jgi:Ca2+-transporting ATPase